MSIDRQNGKIMFECDTCGVSFDSKTGEEFGSVWARAKAESWRTRKKIDKTSGEDFWVHGCGGCGV